MKWSYHEISTLRSNDHVMKFTAAARIILMTNFKSEYDFNTYQCKTERMK